MKQKHSGTARRRRRANRQKRVALTAFCFALVAIMLALGIYIIRWYVNLDRIQTDNERYARLYGRRDAEKSEAAETSSPVPAVTDTPTPTPTVTDTLTPVPTVTDTLTPVPTVTDTLTPVPASTETPSPVPTVTETAAPAPAVTVTDSPTPAVAVTVSPVITRVPTATPDSSPVVPPPGADMPVVEDEPIPTPDADTLVVALPTPPPVQSSFEELLTLNPETVGFLEIEDMLALPVVQRENDNDFYLSHNFEGAEASEGTLFMDGVNRLVPEDDCLIIYGHNMKNKSMFGRLSAYGGLTYLRQHSIIRFDTLYENRSYVVFAAFAASMRQGSSRYFDVRNFIFDQAEFDKFVLKLQSRSIYRSPIDVRYGDGLLLLVTCDYTNREGRFILALRQLREGETEADMWAQAMRTEIK